MFFNIMPGYEKVIFENQPTATSFKARFLFFGPTFVSEEQWPNSLSLLWLLLRRVFHRQLHFLTNFGCFLFGTLNWPARVCAALEVLAGRYPCSCCRTSSPTSSHPVCLANDLVWLCEIAITFSCSTAIKLQFYAACQRTITTTTVASTKK